MVETHRLLGALSVEGTPECCTTRAGLSRERTTMSTYETRTQEGTDQATFIVAGDDAEILEEPRPDDCQCSPLFDDLPCWPCFNAGFEQPNPNVEE